jgi:predicted AAA+ superfamily ATPase
MWLESYIEQLVTRDVALLSPRRDPAKIRTFFSVLAVNTAGTVADATLFDAAGINRETASAYLQLLTNLYVLDTVPAWSANRLAQFTHLPKRYLIDPALVGALLRADRAGVINDPDLLGRLLDTFVATQIRPELTLSQARPRMFHIRDKGGRHEVDLVLEYGARRLVGIEIKANAKPTSQAAQHLRWLRDLVGDRFACGVVLHTGDQAFQVDTNIFAAPISTLWA